ncbi:MAG TPA: hypothetical protein VMX18_02530 [Candidatus Bipolaricaulota bacterium]|nr:hypothetical protein [Candidatus Bipolaricaulota bacterium]
MGNLKKVFTFGVVLATIVWSMGVAAFVPVASAAVLEPGDVIKGSFDAVYFYASDGKRYVYPQDKYYFTWQYDFSVVRNITDSELADISLASNVVTRYGTELVKIQSIPSVYAVSREGDLYKVADQTAAEDLFGSTWSSRILDVQDSFWNNYNDTSTELDGTWYPDGFLLKTAAASDVWLIWDDMKHLVPSEDVFVANRFKWEYVTVTTQAVLDSYTEGDVVSGADATYLDDSQGGGTAAPVAADGTLTVSLASDTPATQTAPFGATGVEVAKYTFTAGSDAAITVNTLAIKRVGLGSPSELSKIYLYDGSLKLTSGKTISTSTNLAYFNNLNLSVGAGQSKTLTLFADIAYSPATNGSHQFEMTNATSISSTAESVVGSFPVRSNTLNISTVQVGKVDVESNGQAYTRKIGEVGVEVSNFSVHVNTVEDAHFSGLTIYNSARDIFNNMKIYRGSDLVSTCTESGDYFVCDLDTAWPIERGDSVSFTAKADVTGRDADTGTLYVRYNTDVRATGDTYGYNMYVDAAVGGSANSYVEEADSSPLSNTTTAEASQLSVAFNGPSSTDVSKNTNKVVLMNFTMTAQGSIDVERATVTMSGTGLAAADMENLELICGGIVVADTASPAATDNAFTDTWSLAAGATECQVRVDVSNTASDGDKILATLKDLTSTSNWVFKDSDTGDAITDIVPSGNIAGNEMTITETSLSIDLAGTPAGGNTYVKGSNGVSTVGFVFTAGNAADVKVNTIKLTAYLDANATTFAAGDKNQASNAEDVISKVAIYDDGATSPLATAKGLTVGTSAITVQFDTLNWMIPAGTSKQLVVKVDLSTTAPYDGTSDRFAMALAAAADVSAEYGFGTSITPNLINGNTDPDTAPGRYQTVTSTGTLTVNIGSATPLVNLVVAGRQGVDFTKVKFAASNEAFVIEKLRIKNQEFSTMYDDEFTSVVLSYTNSVGATVTKSAFLSGGIADFNGLDIYVPKDGDTTITVKGNMNTTSGGADNAAAMSLAFTTPNNFRAVGQGAGTVVLTTTVVAGDSDITATDLNLATNLFISGGNATWAAGECIYRDVASGGTVDATDVRVTDCGTYKIGSTVGASDTDVATVITAATNLQISGGNAAWAAGENAYIGTTATADVVAGTVRVIYTVDGNNQTVYESVPSVAFAVDTPSGNLIPSANTLLAKLAVTADGPKDITFDAATGDITFKISSSCTSVATGDVYLKDSDGVTLATPAAIAPCSATSVKFLFEDVSTDWRVPAGETKYLYVWGDTSMMTSQGDSIQLWLDDASASNFTWSINGIGTYQHANILFRGDKYAGLLLKP